MKCLSKKLQTKFALIFLMSVFLGGCGKSNFLTIQAYGCQDKVEWSICNGKPEYLGEIDLVISKEGKSVKMTQKSAKGANFFSEGTFVQNNCEVTNADNWSCKEKSPYGELYFIYEMVDGFYMSSHTGEYIKGSGLSYVGYQGFKGLAIKYGLWHPTNYFKSGKSSS